MLFDFIASHNWHKQIICFTLYCVYFIVLQIKFCDESFWKAYIVGCSGGVEYLKKYSLIWQVCSLHQIIGH